MYWHTIFRARASYYNSPQFLLCFSAVLHVLVMSFRFGLWPNYPVVHYTTLSMSESTRAPTADYRRLNFFSLEFKQSRGQSDCELDLKRL